MRRSAGRCPAFLEGLTAEFFGQVILVNGNSWPYPAVEPRQYRLRLLNGSNVRFYRLSTDGSGPFPVAQTATEDGFLYQLLPLDALLEISPGERVDLVADFRGLRGSQCTLTNGALTPFPDETPVTPPEDMILQPALGPEGARVAIAGHIAQGPVRGRRAPARLLLLQETDSFGRSRPLLGTMEQGEPTLSNPTTEDPAPKTAEIWGVFDTTPDTYPIHLRLVRFQMLDRAPFTSDQDP
ncbi:cupredoxin domain-containing protein [Streptomyces lonegramiae]|uniref:Multicopper oxidase n=1 Tax=Streptomyces lonegramiae TaxID=3075524 RepID=A0ABU2XFX9_9ACTN|nr:hypothetical protein [Streptomyces sp. DSM 41529]MDT0544801.1 hypothetical protein [Streptomyces sp. DSM 41529]